MTKSIIWSRRLLVTVLSVIVVFGMVFAMALPVYGVDGKNATSSAVYTKADPDSWYMAWDFGPNDKIYARFSIAVLEGVYPKGGDVTFSFEKKVGDEWQYVGSQSAGWYDYDSIGVTIEVTILSEPGEYRVSGGWSGDGYYSAIVDNYPCIFTITDSSPPPSDPVPPVPPSTPVISPTPAAPVVAPPTTTVGKGAKKKVTKTTTGITKKSVKVYAKASQKAKKRTTFKKGKKLTIVGKSGKFYKITFKLKNKAKTGYVLQSSVKVKK
jgi:hypothetical protein